MSLLPATRQKRSGDHVISTDLEHNSVLRPLYRLEREKGVSLSFVPADRQGNIDYADFEKLLRSDTRAVICTHASNLTGNVLDLTRIGQFAHAHGLMFLVDASQSAGVLPIDMEKMHIDVLCFTGHKSLMGPQGTGGLCVREGVDIAPWKVGGTGVQTYSESQPAQMPTRLEAGTLNGHGIAGLSAALDFLQETGIGTIHAHETALLRRFVEGVRNIPGVTLYGNFDCERTAVAALNIGDMDSGEVSDILSEDYGIATRPGAHCALASAGTIRKRKRTLPCVPFARSQHEREKTLAHHHLSYDGRGHRDGKALPGEGPSGAAHSRAARADSRLRHGMARRNGGPRRAHGTDQSRRTGDRWVL